MRWNPRRVEFPLCVDSPSGWVVLLAFFAASLGACSNSSNNQTEKLDNKSTSWTVSKIVDGDTIHVISSVGVKEKVRFIGIDTPETGKCGFVESSDALAVLLSGKTVILSRGTPDDRDKYGRLLRYVDVGALDAGFELIKDGYAIARYDSRDGYARHPRQDLYIEADSNSKDFCG